MAPQAGCPGGYGGTAGAEHPSPANFTCNHSMASAPDMPYTEF